MGQLGEPAPGAGVAVALLLASVALFVWFQELGQLLKREERRAWWAGSGRDLLNAAGFAAIAGSLRLFGFPAPGAVLVGATLTLVLFGAYVFMAVRVKPRHPRAWALGAAAVISAPVVLWPAAVLALFDGIARALFPL